MEQEIKETEKAAGDSYQKGYAAGKKFNAALVKELKRENETLKARLALSQSEQRERVVMRSAEIAFAHLNGWSIGGKKVDSIEGYMKLAKILADNAIDIIGID